MLFTVIVEIVPAEIRSACIGIFLFLMNNIGGNLPTLVALLSKETSLKTTLYIFFPGFVGASESLSIIHYLECSVKLNEYSATSIVREKLKL